LKLIQRWLNYHWGVVWQAPNCVHGFVAGKSHISAARAHLNAQWVISADIEGFFPSVQSNRVKQGLQQLGYDNDSLSILDNLVCLNGALTQGAPTSPILSNIVLNDLDIELQALSKKFGIVYTRYADDIVFSGKAKMPEDLDVTIKDIIEGDGWSIAEKKFRIMALPERLKVHGLLVHGEEVRLTKGYRNRIRAFRHLIENGKVREADIQKLSGHIAYADFIDKQKAEPKSLKSNRLLSLLSLITKRRSQ
jgi:retron-type reverse transcriptase